MSMRELVILADNVAGFREGQSVLLRARQGCFSEVRAVGAGELDAAAGNTNGVELLDLRGLLVLPGLIDAHVHAIASGMLMLISDLHGVSTLEEVAAAVRHETQRSAHVIRLGGMDMSRLGAGQSARITRRWLDDLVPARPLIVKSVEGHSAWFNTEAWKLTGVHAMLERCQVPAAERQRMWEAGRVHGEAYEKLADAIYDTFSAEERREGMARVLRRAVEAGLTGIHCLEGYGARRREDFALVQELDGQGCRLTLYARDADPALARELGLRRFGGCWCVDGAIGARSAAIAEPYTDDPGNTGVLYHSTDALRAWIESGLALDMQVCVHAIGERALDQVIGIYEGLAASYDLPRLRPRVDHFVCGTAELAARAARLGLCSAMQPAFDAHWGGEEGGYAMRLGPERALNTNPVGGMQRAGLRIAGSSDSYITPLDPLGGMRAAMSHHNTAQRVGFDAALELYTGDAAFLAHQEDDVGHVAEGYRADLTVVRGGRDLAGATVALTLLGGARGLRRLLAPAVSRGQAAHPGVEWTWHDPAGRGFRRRPATPQGWRSSHLLELQPALAAGVNAARAAREWECRLPGRWPGRLERKAER